MKYNWRDLATGIRDVFNATGSAFLAFINFSHIPSAGGLEVFVWTGLGAIWTAVMVWSLLQIGAATRDREAAKKAK